MPYRNNATLDSVWNEQSLNTVHISQNMESYEAGRSGFFVFMVEGLDNLVKLSYTGGPENAADANGFMDQKKAEDYLRLNVVKASVPRFSVGVEEYRRGNDVVKYAGVPEFKDGSIVVDDVVGLNTKSILDAWLNLAYDPITRRGGRMINYKKTCKLLEYTQDYELLRTWRLEGCFVSEISEDDFDRENDGKRQLTATIVYDRAIEESVTYEF